MDESQRQYLFCEQRRDAHALALDFDLPLFVPTERNHQVGDCLALSIALVLGNKAFGNHRGQFGVVFTAGLMAIAEHVRNRGGDDRQEVGKAMRQRIGNLDFDCASHCVYHLAVHVVVCTKFRRHTLTWEKRDFLYSIMRQVATHYQREIAEINGEEDHVQFLLRYPPRWS